MTSELRVDAIKTVADGDALEFTTSGVRKYGNYSNTFTYPSASTWTFGAVPSWANKITLITHEVSQSSTGDVNLRFVVGGSAVTSAVYNHSEVRLTNATDPGLYGATDIDGTLATQLKITAFNNPLNQFGWMLTIYKVDTNKYVYNGLIQNDYYRYGNLVHGSIETSSHIEGFNFTCDAGNFDGGRARIFWE